MFFLIYFELNSFNIETLSARMSAKHLQDKQRGPSPKGSIPFAQPPLPPGPERNPRSASLDK